MISELKFTLSKENMNWQQRIIASGAGGEQNYEEAVRWFKAAASQGEPDSMFHLAQLYSEGLGVEKDMNLVAIYLYMAADRGFQPAIDAINKNRIPRPERKE